MRGGESAGLIQCLECGKWFAAIGSHLTRVHGMTAREYRERHDLPAGHKLASQALREAQSLLTKRMIADGTMKNDPLAASEAARKVSRRQKSSADREKQAEIARSLPREVLPPGAKRADGRDAEKARLTQQRRRAGIKVAPAAKITAENIEEARRLWADPSLSREQVAEILGVRLSTLYRRLGPRGLTTSTNP